jgi:predicted HTH transcriptional regulator
MALAINIDYLLNKQRIESNRIEFKKGWNPVSIYHSVCAFANDFDDLGGGYIVVGVDTDDKLPFGLLKEYPLKRLMTSFRIWSAIITR